MVKSQGGQKLFLGEKQTLNVLKSDLVSQNNANTRFYLSVRVPHDEGVRTSTYALVVAGTAYPHPGLSSSQKGTRSLIFRISGKENAEMVSEYMKTPLVCRRRPRHNLRVSFAPTKQEFSVGDRVVVTLQVKNAGTNSASFMQGGRNRGDRDNQYDFSARHRGKQVEDIGTNVSLGGIAFRRTLKPGEVFEDKISLNRWFAFDKAGVYAIHGSYYFDLRDPEGESLRTIWEEQKWASFTVRIREPKEASNKKVDATR